MKKIKYLLGIILLILMGCSSKDVKTFSSWEEYKNAYKEVDGEAVISSLEYDEFDNIIDERTEVIKPERIIEYSLFVFKTDNDLSDPVKSINSWFQALNEADWLSLYNGSHEFEGVPISKQAKMHIFFKNIKCKNINLITEDEDNATAEITFSTYNYEDTVGEYFRNLSTLASEYNLENEDDKQKLREIIDKDIMKIINDTPSIEEIRNVELVKIDDEWKLVVTNEFFELVTGNLANVYRDLQNEIRGE